MTPKHNYARSRQVTHGMISKWGVLGALRRNGVDRPCVVGIRDYKPIERIGKMIDPVDRLAFVSALTPDGSLLDPPPDREQGDMLVTYVPESDPLVEDEVLKISAPTGKLAPGNVVVYYKLSVRK